MTDEERHEAEEALWAEIEEVVPNVTPDDVHRVMRDPKLMREAGVDVSAFPRMLAYSKETEGQTMEVPQDEVMAALFIVTQLSEHPTLGSTARHLGLHLTLRWMDWLRVMHPDKHDELTTEIVNATEHAKVKATDYLINKKKGGAA